MAVGTLSPVPWLTILDANGNPIPGALVYTYLAGTSTPVATYTDVGLIVPNANPIVCDSAGRCTIFLSGGVSYKFVVQTAGGAAVRTQDNISAVPGGSAGIDVVGTAGETLAANDCVYESDGSAGLIAGRWYKASAANAYSSITPTIGFVTGPIALGSTATIRLQGQLGGFVGLTSGAVFFIATAAGQITTVIGSRRVGQADSSTVLNVDVSAASPTQLYSGSGTNTGTGVVSLVSTPMPAFAANDHFTVLIGVYQYQQPMTGGLYLVMGNGTIPLHDLGGTFGAAASVGLWTGTFRMFALSNTIVYGLMSGACNTTFPAVGATRLTQTDCTPGSWSGAGWSLGLQSNGQVSGGTQFWNFKIARG